ncbi:MAG: transposase [Nitrososphaerales archaeon]|jgi:transposase
MPPPLNRFYLDGKRVRSQIPDPPNKTRKRPGRPRRFDRETYHGVRYNVERFFAWLKALRRIATRYERLPSTYLGFVHLGCIVILLRRVSR